MANAGNNVDITTLSDGIYTALITTVAGLIVGIMAYFAYNILVARVEKVVFILEARTSEFMDILNEPVDEE
jgi:biopolymer transport protein ExbB